MRRYVSRWHFALGRTCLVEQSTGTQLTRGGLPSMLTFLSSYRGCIKVKSGPSRCPYNLLDFPLDGSAHIWGRWKGDIQEQQLEKGAAAFSDCSRGNACILETLPRNILWKKVHPACFSTFMLTTIGVQVGGLWYIPPPTSGSHCSNVQTLFTSLALKIRDQLEHLW